MKFQADAWLTNRMTVMLLAILCSMLWGSAFPVLKVSYAELEMAANDLTAKIVYAGMRFLLAGLILLVGMLIIRPKALKVPVKQWPYVVVLGILATGLQYFFFYNGLAHTTGMKAAILVSSGPLFVVLLAPFFYKDDRITWQKGVGLAAGFLGIIFANWGEGFSFSFSLFGAGFLLTAALMSTFGTFLAKKLSVQIHPFALTGWQMVSGSILMLAFGVPNMNPGAMTFTPLAWGLMIYAAFLSAIAFALWFSLLKYNHAGEVSIYKFVVPIAGTVLSAIFIPGEALSVSILGSLSLVALGIFAVYYKKPQEHAVNGTNNAVRQQ